MHHCRCSDACVASVLAPDGAAGWLRGMPTHTDRFVRHEGRPGGDGAEVTAARAIAPGLYAEVAAPEGDRRHGGRFRLLAADGIRPSGLAVAVPGLAAGGVAGGPAPLRRAV